MRFMIKILVVEDDRAINGLVCSYLRDNGYETTACFDGEQALAAMEESAYSMIIKDFNGVDRYVKVMM